MSLNIELIGSLIILKFVKVIKMSPRGPRVSPSGNNQMGSAEAGMVPNKNGAVTSAVLVHLRVEPAHFDWRLAGATRAGTAGVGSHGSRSIGKPMPHPSGVNWNNN